MAPAIRVLSTQKAPVSVRLERLVCPFCKDAIGSSERFVECAACTTWFHEECFLENQGCMTFGCIEQRRGRTPLRVTVLRAQGVVPPAVQELRPRLGNSRLDVALAFVVACAAGTLAMGLTGLVAGVVHPMPHRYGRADGLGMSMLTLGGVAFLTMLIAQLGHGSTTPARTRYTRGQRALCLLCGFVCGLVGIPLLVFALATSF